jgi:hypothetical protein
METQTAVPKRPQRRDKNIIAIAASLLAPAIIEWVESEDGPQPEEEKKAIESQLATAMDRAIYLDGYELAQQLERLGWDPDAALVAELDSANSQVSSAVNKATEDWVKAYNVQPKFKPGDKVKAKWGNKTVIGFVHADDNNWHTKYGQYSLAVEGERGNPIVNWEDCEAVNE